MARKPRCGSVFSRLVEDQPEQGVESVGRGQSQVDLRVHGLGVLDAVQAWSQAASSARASARPRGPDPAAQVTSATASPSVKAAASSAARRSSVACCRGGVEGCAGASASIVEPGTIVAKAAAAGATAVDPARRRRRGSATLAEPFLLTQDRTCRSTRWRSARRVQSNAEVDAAGRISQVRNPSVRPTSAVRAAARGITMIACPISAVGIRCRIE